MQHALETLKREIDVIDNQMEIFAVSINSDLESEKNYKELKQKRFEVALSIQLITNSITNPDKNGAQESKGQNFQRSSTND